MGALLCTASIIFYSLMAGGLAPNDTKMWRVGLGIVLPLLSALCYYVSNVLQVHLTERHGRDYFMYYLGLFGSLLSLTLSIPLIRVEVSTLMSRWQEGMFVLPVVISLLFFSHLCASLSHLRHSHLLQHVLDDKELLCTLGE